MTTILIKKKDTAGAPAAGDLTNAAGGAEIAVNTATKRIYSKDSGGAIIEMGTFPSSMAVQGNLSATGTLGITGATNLNGAVTLGDASADNITVTGTITSNLIFTDATYDIGASGANRPRDLFLSRNLTVGGTLTLAGGVNLNGNVTVGDSSSDTLTINSTITSNLIFTDNTYDIGASGATRPRSLYLGTLANITTAAGQILITPTGYRVADRASILIKTLTNNPAEIDLLTTSGGLNYGWQISSRTGTTPTLDFYRNTNNAFAMGFQMGSTENVANPDLADVDFRVASDTNAYMLFVDGGLNHVNIGTSSDLGGVLNIAGTNTGIAFTYGDTVPNNPLHTAFYGSITGLGMDSTGSGVRVAGDPNANVLMDVGWYSGGSVSHANWTRRFTVNQNSVVVNENSADVDFRVESDNNAYMMWVDASADGVNIGGFDTIQGQLNVMYAPGSDVASTSSIYITTGNQYGSPARPKFLDLVFQGYRDGAGSGGGAKARIRAIEQTANSRSGRLEITTLDGSGNLILNQLMTASDVVFNSDSVDMDFRVASDTNAYAFFLDAGTNRINVGTSSAYEAAFTTSATGAYSSGDVNAIFVNPSGRPTVRLRSLASEACELFFDTGGGVAWDISCRSVSEGKQMLWFPSAATPSYSAVGGQVMSLTQAGNLTIVGALAKGSGSFQIDHPLPSLNETHHLVHSFVEAPQADLYYRGKVALVNGRATVNIDQVAGMTEGTFVLLNREVQCFTSNETDWDAVRGSVSGNILTIECQNASSTATISWMVVGERQDKHMYDTDWTDENGKVIVEPVKPPPVEPPTFDR